MFGAISRHLLTGGALLLSVFTTASGSRINPERAYQA